MANRSETEEDEVPGPSGTVRLEDLQETVQSLVQRALEANQSGTHPTTPHGDSGKWRVSASLPSRGGDQVPHAGEPLMPTVRNVTTG